MLFNDTSLRLFWMTEVERFKIRIDMYLTGKITKARTKEDLLVDLQKIGVDTTSRRFKKPELVEVSLKYSIPVLITTNSVKPG